MSSTDTLPSPDPNPNPKGRSVLYLLLLFLFLVAVMLAACPFFDSATITVVTLTSFSVSSFNLTSDSLSADFDLALAIDNPSSVKSFYIDSLVATVYLGQAIDNSKFNSTMCDSLTAAVYLGLNRLAATALGSLFLSKSTSVTLHARMAAVSVFIGEDTANSIRSGFQKGDANVKFDLLVGAVDRSETSIMMVDFDINVAFKNASGAMNNGLIRDGFRY